MATLVEIPISKHFSKERVDEIHGYAKERLQSLNRGLMEIRERKVSQWRKVYNGTPREKTKSFPWQNASNVVIQLVGSFVDQLVAKIVMGSIAMDPIFVAEIVGEWGREERAEEQRTAVEDWLAYVSLEPTRLNLLPKHVIWIRTMVKYGFGAIKIIPETRVEQVAQRVSDSGEVEFTSFTRNNGPVALPLQFEDFLMPSTTIELERSPFLAQRAVMERFELKDMAQNTSFDSKAITEALKSPTRQGPTRTRQAIETESGAKTDSGAMADNWDLYECHFPYLVGGKRFQIISTCIADETCESPKFLKDVFNWLPDNSLPYIGARLGSDGENPYGRGFCEMLKDYQEEVTAIHNRRGDASTLANTNLIRVDPGQQIDSQFSVYPNATISGGKDAYEVIPLGRTANETIKDEQMTLQLAQDRAGVGPSSSGAGAGTVNKKGTYSAMGAFPVLQEGNTRANLNITEFRQSHYCCGRLSLLYYAHFGVTEADLRAMGQKGPMLQKALDNVRDGRIILPIRAATGSVNKEIEKQSLMLLLNNTRAHWQMINGLLQAASNPMAPPEMQDYMLQVILASNALMKRISREFNISDPTAYLPEPLGVQEKADRLQQLQKMQQQPQLPGGPQPPTGPAAAPPQPQAPDAPSEQTVTQ